MEDAPLNVFIVLPLSGIRVEEDVDPKLRSTATVGTVFVVTGAEFTPTRMVQASLRGCWCLLLLLFLTQHALRDHCHRLDHDQVTRVTYLTIF